MSKAATFARRTFRDSVDFVRMAIVLGCAGALILAGQALPFYSFNKPDSRHRPPASAG